MDTQPISNCCPKCHAPLPPDAPQGLCPKCLFAAVATPTEAGQPAGHRATPPPLEEIAAAFPQLEILEFVGQGGMGFVFKARQPKLDRLVALKILPQSLAADPTFAERFNREARLLARLSHPGIVTVHDFGVASHQLSTPNSQPFYYLLMEFVDGVNLRQAMQAGRFTPEQALAIVPKICEALQFAHNEGILHRDIKPENILLDAKGRVKLADFGIAKLMERGSATRSTSETSPASGFTEDSLVCEAAAGHRPALHALTESGKTLGTPNYMAPEQLERPQDVDHRADIYSLGVVFYEMLTGELPRGQFAPPSQKSAADPRVDEVVLRALEKEKARRYASADEVRTQVETITGSAGVPPAEPGVAPGSCKTDLDKRAVGATPTTPTGTVALPGSRFSRTAIVGACLGIAFPVFAVGSVLIRWKLSFALLLLLLGFVATTLLGWIAVTQIRHSAGRLYGLGLAVFEGLLFPLLALNFSIGCFVWVVLTAVVSLIARNGHGTPGTALVVLLSLPIAIPLNRSIIRRVWRAVNEGGSNALPVGPRLARWVGAGLACVVCALVSVAAFFHTRNENADPMSFANRPDKLRSLPTDKIIQVGLEKPESPWAWQELEKRAKSGDLHGQEANIILDGYTAWMQREHPQGYNQPLHWIGNLLEELNKPWLMGETNALAFLEAYYGSPSIEPLPRLRENASSLHLTCKWRSPWLNQSLGFELLNEMRSISIDGQQLPANRNSPQNWSEWQYSGELALPKLAPGKHVVRCEVDSALVAASEMAGLAKDASSKGWPPAKRRWTRICEAEFTVHANDAEIVSLTDDPTLNPMAGGALAIPQVIIRAQGGRLTATASFVVKDRPSQPVSVDVTLRLPGQTIQCGNIYEVNTSDGGRHRGARNDHELTVDIGPLDPQIKEAEIVLTPNPKAVEEYPHVDRIWSKEIVISHVPLSRQDLYGAKPVTTAKAPASITAFSPVRELVLVDIGWNGGWTKSHAPMQLLNLDSGKGVALAEVFQSGWAVPALTTEWEMDALRIRNIDIGCNLAQSRAGLVAWDCSVKAMGTVGWVATDKPSEKQHDWGNRSLNEMIQEMPTPITNTMQVLAGELPGVWLLKNRQGDYFIIEAYDTTNNPRGVKIRYKLVHKSGSTSTP